MPVPQAYELCVCVAWMQGCVHMPVFMWACTHRPEDMAVGLHYGLSFCPAGLGYSAVCIFYFFETGSPAVQLGLELTPLCS